MTLPLWKLDPRAFPPPLRQALGKEVHLWLFGWAKDRAKKKLTRSRDDGPKHLLFSLCDHYEPLHGGADHGRGRARVMAWRTRYPEMAKRFYDASGRHPRHSYFFPGEQYDPAYIEPLAEMCEMGLGEVEVHLHHDGDTARLFARGHGEGALGSPRARRRPAR